MLLESPQNSRGADFGIMWRVEKDKMEVATGVTWTESERGPRMLQRREHFTERISGDIRGRQTLSQWLTPLACKSSTNSRHFLRGDSDGQDPRMDRRGQKRVGSKFAACMLIYNKLVLTEWRMPTPAMQEYLKRGMLSILLCVKRVCAGTFDVHEWVSESTIAEQDEEVTGRDLGDEICIPCVVQWSMLWFPRQCGQIKHWKGKKQSQNTIKL